MNRPPDHLKSTQFFHLSCRDTGSGKLGEDKTSVGDDIRQSGGLNSVGHLLRGKSPFPGCAPDVDAAGVHHQNPDADTRKIGPQDIEGEFVVGGDHYR
jgi:hypothetical protein